MIGRVMNLMKIRLLNLIELLLGCVTNFTNIYLLNLVGVDVRPHHELCEELLLEPRWS